MSRVVVLCLLAHLCLSTAIKVKLPPQHGRDDDLHRADMPANDVAGDASRRGRAFGPATVTPAAPAPVPSPIPPPLQPPPPTVFTPSPAPAPAPAPSTTFVPLPSTTLVTPGPSTTMVFPPPFPSLTTTTVPAPTTTAPSAPTSSTTLVFPPPPPVLPPGPPTITGTTFTSSSGTGPTMPTTSTTAPNPTATTTITSTSGGSSTTTNPSTNPSTNPTTLLTSTSASDSMSSMGSYTTRPSGYTGSLTSGTTTMDSNPSSGSGDHHYTTGHTNGMTAPLTSSTTDDSMTAASATMSETSTSTSTTTRPATTTRPTSSTTRAASTHHYSTDHSLTSGSDTASETSTTGTTTSTHRYTTGHSMPSLSTSSSTTNPASSFTGSSGTNTESSVSPYSTASPTTGSGSSDSSDSSPTTSTTTGSPPEPPSPPSPPPAPCDEIAVENGQSCPSTPDEGSCAPTCNDGYKATQTGLCDDGSWDPAPACDVDTDYCAQPTAGDDQGTVDGCCTELGSSCDFYCSSDAYTPSVSGTTCKSPGTQSASTFTCNKVDPYCTAPTVANGGLESVCTTIDSTCGVICNSGYEAVSDTITCQQGGVYDNVAQCTPKDDYCTEPADPPTGCDLGDCVIGDCTQIDEVCELSCDPGYAPSATSSTCQAGDADNGVQTEPNPTCDVIENYCTMPDDPENGLVLGDCSTIGGNCIFSCEVHYELDGAEQLTCIDGGILNGEVPTCEPTPPDCTQPNAPANGAIQGTCTHADDACTVACNRGYVVKGANPITCQADGTFDNPLPTCDPAPNWCPVNAAPLNGQGGRVAPNFLCDGTYLTKCTYSCNVGFKMVGAAQSTCNVMQQYKPDVPQCNADPKFCPQPAAPNKGKVVGQCRQINQQCTFVCDEGYILNGAAATTCQAQGNVGAQSNPTPLCQPDPNYCAGNVPLPNGNSFIVNGPCGTAKDDKCEFHCNKGFKPEKSTSVCGAGVPFGLLNVYFPAPPICVVDLEWCHPLGPDAKAHEIIIPYCGVLTSSCLVGCETGYALKNGMGAMLATCQVDKTFFPDSPGCDAIPEWCAQPADPANAKIEGCGQHKIGTHCLVHCKKGYLPVPGALVGTELICQADHSYLPFPASCAAAPGYCQALAVPANGHADGACDTRVEGECNFKCNDGYVRDTGFEKHKCKEDTDTAGKWGDAPLTCKKKDGYCDDPPKPTHGFTKDPCMHTIDSACTRQCDKGYSKASGDLSTTCSANGPDKGKWSGTSLTCNPIANYCPVMATPANAHADGACDRKVDGDCNFKCDDGYERDSGFEKHKCQIDSDTTGKWGDAPLVCKKKQGYCTNDPPKPNHGFTTSPCSHMIGDVCTRQCDKGYELNTGSLTVTCSANGPDSGKWAGDNLDCKKSANYCPTTPVILNTKPLDPSACGHEIDDACGPFECTSTDFKIKGSKTVHCEADGTYGELPRCVGPCDGAADGSACDDGKFCNGKDFCQKGECTGHDGNPCNTTQPCGEDCSETLKICQYKPDRKCGPQLTCVKYMCEKHDCKAYDQPFDVKCDGPPDEPDAHCSFNGTCHGPKVGGCDSDDNCTAADQCRLGKCVDHVCQYSNREEGAPCDDTVFCNGHDKCDGKGNCTVHDGNPCANGDVCNKYCNEASENCFTPYGVNCATGNDTNQCRISLCDGRGVCDHPPKPDGTRCSINDTCRVDTRCFEGECSGQSTCHCDADANCTTGNACIVATCVENVCHYEKMRNGTGCHNGNQCSYNPTCDNGLCLGTMACPMTNDHLCSGHGKCCKQTCTCDEGWSGEACESGPQKLDGQGGDNGGGGGDMSGGDGDGRGFVFTRDLDYTSVTQQQGENRFFYYDIPGAPMGSHAVVLRRQADQLSLWQRVRAWVTGVSPRDSSTSATATITPQYGAAGVCLGVDTVATPYTVLVGGAAVADSQVCGYGSVSIDAPSDAHRFYVTLVADTASYSTVALQTSAPNNNNPDAIITADPPAEKTTHSYVWIGVGVGAALAWVALAVFGYVMYKRREKRRGYIKTNLLLENAPSDAIADSPMGTTSSTPLMAINDSGAYKSELVTPATLTSTGPPPLPAPAPAPPPDRRSLQDTVPDTQALLASSMSSSPDAGRQSTAYVSMD